MNEELIKEAIKRQLKKEAFLPQLAAAGAKILPGLAGMGRAAASYAKPAMTYLGNQATNLVSAARPMLSNIGSQASNYASSAKAGLSNLASRAGQYAKPATVGLGLGLAAPAMSAAGNKMTQASGMQ